MNLVDISGLVSSILICLMFVPEVAHVYKHKDAKAINYSFLHLNLIASVLALIYSVHYNVIPMTITNVSAGIFSLTLFHFKYVNELKGENQSIDEVGVWISLQPKLLWCSGNTADFDFNEDDPPP